MQKTITGNLAADGLEIHHLNGTVPEQFQVFGERSSGTNLAARLIRRHTDLAQTESLGWKHGFPQMVGIAPNIVIIVTFRDALDWVQSMYTKPWHSTPALQALGFSEFLRAEWQSHLDRKRYFDDSLRSAIHQPLQQDRHPLSGLAFENLLQMRNHKLAAHLGYRNRSCNLVLARMETLRDDPEGFLQKFAHRFTLPEPTSYSPITRSLGSRFKAAVPTRHKPPRTLSATDMSFVCDALDPQIESELGYSYPPEPRPVSNG